MQASAGSRGGLESTTIPVLEDLARIHQGVLLFAPDGRIVWMSQALASRFHGNSVRRWEDLFALPQAGRRLWEELRVEGRLTNSKAELLSDHESERVALTAVRLDWGGDPGPVVALIRSETSDGSSQEEIQRLRGYLRSILDCSPDAALAIDPSGFILHANRGVQQLLGWPVDTLVDQPVSLYLHRREDLDRIAAGVRCGGPANLDDIEVVASDGKVIPVRVSAATLRSPEGQLAGAICFVRQGSSDEPAQTALERRTGELEHTLRAVSHDLRSPLLALLGFTRLLRDDCGDGLGEKGRYFLQRIEQAGRTMESLVQDILEVAKIGQTETRKTLVDPREVLLQLQAEFKPRLEETRTRLVLPDELPLLNCDRTRLYQVLSNLVGNALDHMGTAEDPFITVQVVPSGREDRLSVRDNGRGIAPEHHERVFEIFQSLGPGSDGRRGSGVGLAIVKKIAETHGGRAWVESEPGQGATFHVTFPRDTARERQRAQSDPRRLGAVADPSHGA